MQLTEQTLKLVVKQFRRRDRPVPKKLAWIVPWVRMYGGIDRFLLLFLYRGSNRKIRLSLLQTYSRVWRTALTPKNANISLDESSRRWLRLLLLLGADVNKHNCRLSLSECLACGNNPSKIASFPWTTLEPLYLLYDEGADVRYFNPLCQRYLNTNVVDLHIQKLVERGVNSVDDDGETWLFRCEKDYMLKLLRAGVDPNIQNKNQETALHKHLNDKCYINVIELLARVTTPSLTNSAGQTPLMLICANWITNIRSFSTININKLIENGHNLRRFQQSVIACLDQAWNSVSDEHDACHLLGRPYLLERYNVLRRRLVEEVRDN